MPTSDHIDGYLRHLREELRRAPGTVARYGEELRLLVARGTALTREGVGGFVAYAGDGSELAVSALGERELGRVVAALAADPPSWRRSRDAAILALLFYAGLRLSELVRLDLSQVDLASEALRGALRKGGGTTDVVLHPYAVAALEAWAGPRPGVPCPALFVTAAGRRLSARMVQKRLAALGRAAGLGVSLHPHAPRHAHGTGMLTAGVALELIRVSFNHESLETTRTYLYADLALVRAAVGLRGLRTDSGACVMRVLAGSEGGQISMSPGDQFSVSPHRAGSAGARHVRCCTRHGARGAPQQSPTLRPGTRRLCGRRVGVVPSSWWSLVRGGRPPWARGGGP
jgi:site-specific recombinase XerC